MKTETPQPLSPEALAEIEVLSAKVPDGPWFASMDDAEDCPDHRRSGLAMVDTGRSADWWIARLCEWPVANFIAASKINIDSLCQSLRAAWKERDTARAAATNQRAENRTLWEANKAIVAKDTALREQLAAMERERNEALDQCVGLHLRLDQVGKKQ